MNDRHTMALPYFESAFLLSTTEKTKREPLLLLLDWKPYIEFNKENPETSLKTIDTALKYTRTINLKLKRILICGLKK